ncbi:MAG TPA: AfsR/SARP family transcriptional regulator [Mycobacterium sp.]|nr:AfsR/SARP family transcriptional regulator [Mycobacterium sp.]
MECGLQFAVLGTLRISARGTPIGAGGITQRAVLAYLLLNSNKVVPNSEMLAAIWHDDPPLTARKMVHNSVAAIRKMLNAHVREADAPALVTQPPGYQLHVDHDSVDLHLFRRLVALGRADLDAGQPVAARRRLRQGLDLWRGRALADLVESGVDWPELTAIEDERISAYEDYFAAELACGRHREITPELKVLTAAEPLRESLVEIYMVALYRSGRQVEALNVFRHTREALLDGLGIEPGPALQRQYQLILLHDSSLQVEALGRPAQRAAGSRVPDEQQQDDTVVTDSGSALLALVGRRGSNLVLSTELRRAAGSN